MSVAVEHHLCPHCGRGIPLDQRRRRCRACGGLLGHAGRDQSVPACGCLTAFGLTFAAGFLGALILVTVYVFRRGLPVWRLTEVDLARVTLLALLGGLLGLVAMGLTVRALPQDRYVFAEEALTWVAFPCLVLLLATLCGAPPRLAAAVSLLVGALLAWLFCRAADRQRLQDATPSVIATGGDEQTRYRRDQ